MATYEELRNQYMNDALRNRVSVAISIAAYDLLTGASPTSNERVWALHAIDSPDSVADQVIKLVLAANKDATVANIEAATDAAIQSNVDSVVAQLVSAYSGV